MSKASLQFRKILIFILCLFSIVTCEATHPISLASSDAGEANSQTKGDEICDDEMPDKCDADAVIHWTSLKQDSQNIEPAISEDKLKAADEQGIDLGVDDGRQIPNLLPRFVHPKLDEWFEKGTYPKDHKPDEFKVNYRLFKPAGDGNEKYPLVIFLHGIGADERAYPNVGQLKHLERMFFKDLESKTGYKFFMMVPQLPYPFKSWVSNIPTAEEEKSFKENEIDEIEEQEYQDRIANAEGVDKERRSKSLGKVVFPNDPEETPDAVPADHLTDKAKEPENKPDLNEDGTDENDKDKTDESEQERKIEEKPARKRPTKRKAKAKPDTETTNTNKSEEKKSAPVDYVEKIIDELLKQNPAIDPERICIVGVSAGGSDIWEIARRNPKRYAAIVPLGSYRSDLEEFESLSDLSVWAFQNKGDRPENAEGMISKLNDAGGWGYFTQTSGKGHNCWYTAFGEDYELMPWILKQRHGSHSYQWPTWKQIQTSVVDYWPQWAIGGVFFLSIIAMVRDSRKKRRAKTELHSADPPTPAV